MKFTSIKDTRGFTLIELLVVISIISLLSSILFASFSVARAKSIDARKMADGGQVKIALQGFYNDKNAMPSNYICSGGTCSADTPTSPRSTIEIEKTDGAYEKSMQDLVSDNVLSGIPHSPDVATPYSYFNYGSGSAAGALFGTTLIAASPSTTGQSGSCRPNAVPTAAFPLCSATWGANNNTCSVTYDNGTVCTTTGGVTTCNGPTTNICDTSSSKDYCVCNPY